MGSIREYRDLHSSCELCGEKNSLDVHHLIPQSLGGSDRDENLLVVCKKCHAKLTPSSELTTIGMKRKWKERHRNDEMRKYFMEFNDLASDVIKKDGNAAELMAVFTTWARIRFPDTWK
jgi:hypothetical protein